MILEMEIQTKFILVLAVADTVIVAVFYRWLRSTPPMDKKTFSANRAGLIPFVMHALLCFKGIFLVFQLTIIAVLYALCYLQHIGKISNATVIASKERR